MAQSTLKGRATPTCLNLIGRPPLLPKSIDERAPNSPEVNLLPFKQSQYDGWYHVSFTHLHQAQKHLLLSVKIASLSLYVD